MIFKYWDDTDQILTFVLPTKYGSIETLVDWIMRNKHKLNGLKKAYFKVPNKIHDIGLSATAIAIYSYLAKQPEDFNPPVSVIGRSLKISKNTVVKYLQELKNRNVIKCYEFGREKVTSKYEFINGGDWK
jgi:predicted DNA-binding transcriptional regulator